IVCKMIEFIPGKDRFQKMHRFTNCFLESEVVDFLSEGQYLESSEAPIVYSTAIVGHSVD
ncbi:hypothetical protein S83_015289, partial [Arachis hypogaea]